MGIDVSKADVQKMLEGKGWLKKYLGEASGDPDALEDLTDEIADAIEDDPSLVQTVLKATKKDTGFNRSFGKALVDELD